VAGFFAGPQSGLNCMKVQNGDYCAPWCNSWTNSFSMCEGCSSGHACEPWTPVDTEIIQWNADTDTLPDHCVPENTNWGAKFPYPRGPALGYGEVPMDCCTSPTAKRGADLYIGATQSLYFPKVDHSTSDLDTSLGTSDQAQAFRSNGNNPCIQSSAVVPVSDSFADLAGCQNGHAYYGEGCHSYDATKRCECVAIFKTEAGAFPKCYRGGDYAGPIRWFFLHKGCLAA